MVDRNLDIIVEEESGRISYQGTIGEDKDNHESDKCQIWELTLMGSPKYIRPATPEEVGELVYGFVLENDHLRRDKREPHEEPASVYFSITSRLNNGEDSWPLVAYSNNYGGSSKGVRSYRELTPEEAVRLGQRLEKLFSEDHYLKTPEEIEKEEQDRLSED